MVAALIVVVRPLSVALSIWPRQLDLRGRTIIALTAPRGIVAAAVASLAAREMGKAGLAGAAELEGLVYLTILATGAWSTLAALVLPKILGYTDDPARRKAVLVGANALSETLARVLSAAGTNHRRIDASSWRLDRFRAAGLPTRRRRRPRRSDLRGGRSRTRLAGGRHARPTTNSTSWWPRWSGPNSASNTRSWPSSSRRTNSAADRGPGSICFGGGERRCARSGIAKSKTDRSSRSPSTHAPPSRWPLSTRSKREHRNGVTAARRFHRQRTLVPRGRRASGSARPSHPVGF